jgi:ATP-dependent Clp protease protease subunit
MLIKLNEEQFKNSSPQQSIFLLFEEISSDSSKNCVQWIMDANFASDEKAEVLTLIINSPGGSMSAAFAIIDTIRGSHIPVRTIGLGEISSAGLMVFISGVQGHRVLTENTSIMSHTWSWGHMGKSHELIAATREYDLTSERMMNHYKRCTGLAEKKIKKYLLPPQDVYLSAAEALELGICDKISNLK